ncbi:hypothetical protein EVAR_69288_1 [Eumeta japonica]|uniref:Uncharacterized protein n=1 Tax=Eumeta variegata TaxID=151549 RepID=A0A4C1SCP6_EUMVA|nr:hypothetical protein EVAR_69288_1 [Eumeta japonica]
MSRLRILSMVSPRTTPVRLRAVTHGPANPESSSCCLCHLCHTSVTGEFVLGFVSGCSPVTGVDNKFIAIDLIVSTTFAIRHD